MNKSRKNILLGLICATAFVGCSTDNYYLDNINGVNTKTYLLNMKKISQEVSISKNTPVLCISMYDNPTTGYSWKYSINDNFMTMVSSNLLKSKESNTLVGTAQERRMCFHIKEDFWQYDFDSTSINLTYSQSWNNNSEKSYVVKVNKS